MVLTFLIMYFKYRFKHCTNIYAFSVLGLLCKRSNCVVDNCNKEFCDDSFCGSCCCSLDTDNPSKIEVNLIQGNYIFQTPFLPCYFVGFQKQLFKAILTKTNIILKKFLRFITPQNWLGENSSAFWSNILIN